MARTQVRALVATVGMALLFGTSFVASKIALAAFSPTQLVFLRFFVAAIFFTLAAKWFPEQPLPSSQLKQVLFLALLEPGAYFVLESYGLKLTLASTASVLIATIPLFVVVAEVLFLKMRVKLFDMGLILLSLLGVGLLFTAGENAHRHGGSLLGNALVLGAAITASAYTLVARRIMATVDAFSVTRWQAYFACLLYGPFAALAWIRGAKPLTSYEPWLAVGYLGVACSFAAYFLLNYALARLRPSLVAAFSNLIPVVATALAVLLLDETLELLQGLGAVVTVGAVATLTLRQKEPPSPGFS